MTDWQVGSIALCVKRGPWTIHGFNGPRYGEVHIVRKVDFGGLLGCEDGVRLYLERWPGGLPSNSWAAQRFRKINPLTDEERESFLRELNEPVEVES